MAKLSIVVGSTSKLVDVFIQDSSSTTGAGLTGLTNLSSSLTWYYYIEGAASAVQVTSIASMTLGTWTSKGFIVIDGTNMPGCYQLGIPDAALTGGKSVIMMLKGVTNMVPLVLEIELTATNNQDAVRGGMTALPNANAAASGGLPTIGATIPNATAGATGGLFIAGTNAATTITTALTATFTGNLTGSVASVSAGVTLAASAVQAIWDALTSALTTVGSVGKLLVDNVNATISSRLASASYTAPDNTSTTAIKAKTDNLPASPAAVGDIPTANQNADALLDRAAGVETNRTPRQAFRLMLAALTGKLSGAATVTVAIRDTNDTKDRILATVDADGNRSAVTLDAN